MYLCLFLTNFVQRRRLKIASGKNIDQQMEPFNDEQELYLVRWSNFQV